MSANSIKEKPSDVDGTATTTDISKGDEVQIGNIIRHSETDPVLATKMYLLNEAMNQIGLTTYHWKLFCLSGMGYAVDSLIGLLQGIANAQVVLEYQPSYQRGAQVALYTGLLFGALFWGLSADIVGRKWAFNLSLLMTSIFCIGAGAAPSYIAWSVLIAISAFGEGGNLVLDTTVFLEYLPAKKQWLVTLMAAWWGVGQTVAGFLAWAYIPNFSCTSADECPRASNMGWRYLYYTSGALVLVMSVARVLFIRFHETPKYLLCKGKDEEVVRLLQNLAQKAGRDCGLTLEMLSRHGPIQGAHSEKAFSLGEIAVHYRGLFKTRKLGLSTILVWVSWTLIGLAWPLFYVFLPDYLTTRGAEFGQHSASVAWRNYVLAQICAIFGPLLGGYMCNTRLGRKYTMVIGALISMAFFFAYTAVRNNAQNVGFNCATSVTLNIYYGVLYAYSPEVLPSAHRATGNGTAVAFNRIMGIMSAIIGTYANTATPVPIYICGGLFAVMALVSATFPFEPYSSQSG